MKKVVCIERCNFHLTLGKVYECVEWNNRYEIINDNGNEYSYSKKLFCTKKEYRRLKLLELKKVSEL